jgi:putative hydrolase of the HAD superfamily
LRACSAKADEVFYFDDLLTNVCVAESIGMQAYHVDGFQSLLRVLKGKGLA